MMSSARGELRQGDYVWALLFSTDLERGCAAATPSNPTSGGGGGGVSLDGGRKRLSS